MTQNNVIQFPLQAQVFNLRQYAPQDRPLELVESGSGTCNTPHQIVEFVIKATASRVEAAVLWCLIRYTLGFQRSQCETSYSFIGNWTGLSIASVRKGVESLLSSGLIVCLRPGSFSQTAIYEIPVVRDHLKFEKQRQISTAPSNNPPKETAPAAKDCTPSAQESAGTESQSQTSDW